MNLVALCNVGLLALVGIVLALAGLGFPIACYRRNFHILREEWRQPLGLMFGFLQETLGTVAVTYFHPISGTTIAGTTVAPTQTVMAQRNLLVAQVFMDTSDTVATVTHNFNLPTTTTAGPPDTVELLPEVNLIFNNLGTALPFLTVSSPPGANTIGINKTNLANSSCTVTVYIRRPFSPNM